MKIDRRNFARALALGGSAGILGFPRIGLAEPGTAAKPATLIVDLASGRTLHRSGPCETRFSPCSTFKIPLALMGYDAGILKSAHDPAWQYRPEIDYAVRAVDKQRVDPTSWEADSVVWYSQALTRRLGEAKFKAYIDRFGYGNRDVRGNPGKQDGLTQSWLGSSLRISADEQVAFLRRMLGHRLVSPAAHALAEAIIPAFEGSGGWAVHGKTGSGWLNNAPGEWDRTQPLGWFVGWAKKGTRRLAFASVETGAGLTGSEAFGPTVRSGFLRKIGALVG